MPSPAAASPAPESPATTSSTASAAGAAAGSGAVDLVGRMASRTNGMSASEIRALFAVASRPEVVSLAGGMPNLAALPLDILAGQVSELIASDGQVALQYGTAQGVPALREQITEVMAAESIRAHADDVVVTVG